MLSKARTAIYIQTCLYVGSKNHYQYDMFLTLLCKIVFFDRKFNCLSPKLTLPGVFFSHSRAFAPNRVFGPQIVFFAPNRVFGPQIGFFVPNRVFGRQPSSCPIPQFFLRFFCIFF